MPLFTAQIFHTALGQKWTNVYTIQATDISEANDAVQNILVPALLATYRVDLTITETRVSTPGSASTDFITTPLNADGEVSSGGVTYLPLYNRFLVEVSVDAFKRPSRKYFTTPMTEGDQENGTVVAGAISAIQTVFNNLIEEMNTNGTPLTNDSGDEWLQATVGQAVQMRQLHRKRRKSTP